MYVGVLGRTTSSQPKKKSIGEKNENANKQGPQGKNHKNLKMKKKNPQEKQQKSKTAHNLIWGGSS